MTETLKQIENGDLYWNFIAGFEVDPRLFICFAGADQHRYQWKRTMERYNLNHMLVRDTALQYYQYGVKGVGDRRQTIEFFRGWRQVAPKLITLGISSGSYGAMLYGQLIPTDFVLAFSPLSGRDTDDFPPQDAHRIHDPNTPLDDLRKYFVDGPVARTRAFIGDEHYTCCLDHRMAARVGITDVTIVKDSEHKDTAGKLRDRGELAAIFEACR